MKHTAVEWLVEQLNEKIDFIPLDKWDMIRDIIQQAKAMEKQQIIKACDAGFDDGSGFIEDMKYQSAEQYYNETYL
jgi:hypothetical protein